MSNELSTYKLVNNANQIEAETFKIKNRFIPEIRENIIAKLVYKYGNAKKIKLWTKSLVEGVDKNGETYTQESYNLWRPGEPLDFVDGMTIYYSPPETYKKHIYVYDYSDKKKPPEIIEYYDENELRNELLNNGRHQAIMFMRDVKNNYTDSYKRWDGTLENNMSLYYLKTNTRGGFKSKKCRTLRRTSRRTLGRNKCRNKSRGFKRI